MVDWTVFWTFLDFTKMWTRWNFESIFLRIVHQKGLFDTIKENPNFPHCRRILDIYWQWLLICKKTKKFYRKEKKYRRKRTRIVVQIMTVKITTLWTLYVHVVSNSVMFPQILYDIVLYDRHFLPVKIFPSITFINCFELPQNVTWDRWITRVISSNTGTNEVRLAHHI